MWKSKSKKGYTLVEVICALTVLAIFIVSATTTELYYYSTKKYNKSLMESTFLMEAIKNNILDQYTYDQINSLQNNRDYFIIKENMNLNNVKNSMFINDLLEQVPLKDTSLEKPYIVIRKESAAGGCIKIKLAAYIQKNNGSEVLKVEFLKGHY